MKLPEVVTKKVGPFPVGVWAIIGSVGLVIGLKISKGSRKNNGTTVVPIDSSTSAGLLPSGLQPSSGGSIGLPNNAASYTSGYTPPSIESNNDWYKVALGRIIGLGISPTAASNALTQYLQGRSLDEQSQAIVDEALRSTGPAPTAPPVAGLPQPTSPNIPIPKQTYLDPVTGSTGEATSVPTNRGSFVTRPGDTIDDVIKYVYGAAADSQGYDKARLAIRQANPTNLAGVQDGQAINPNTTVWLPWNPWLVPKAAA